MLNPTIFKLSEVKKIKPDFYIKDFLPVPKSAITLISANGGTGKTFLSIQMALQLTNQLSNAKVLLWLSEDDKGIIKHRTELIQKTILNSDFKDDNIDIIDDMPEHIDISNFSVFKEIFQPYNLVVIDPLIAFYGGDENNNAQARHFMNLINRIARENKQSILIIHHSTKSTKEQESRTRGAGAFVDACRLAYEITNIEDETSIKRVNITKDNYGVKQILNSDFKDIKILPFDSSFVKIEYEEKPYLARSVMEFI